MSGLSHDIAAMVANHAAGDEDGFCFLVAVGTGNCPKVDETQRQKSARLSKKPAEKP